MKVPPPIEPTYVKRLSSWGDCRPKPAYAFGHISVATEAPLCVAHFFSLLLQDFRCTIGNLGVAHRTLDVISQLFAFAILRPRSACLVSRTSSLGCPC